MGLNINYSLLFEDNNSNYQIPDYRKTYTPEPFGEAYMMKMVSDFNQEIRESRNLLSSIYEIESINEATAAVNIVNGIKTVIDKVRKAIMTIANKIIELYEMVIKKISNKVGYIKDSIEKKYRYHERIKLLTRALKEADKEEKTVRIASLTPTSDLLDKSFPDTSIIGSDLAKMVTDTMNNYCTNIIQKDGGHPDLLDDTEVKASETFVNYIESQKDGILSKIFGKYQYDPTAITKSANDVAEKAFGSNEKNDTELSLELYGEACDNLERAESILKDINSTYSDFKKDYYSIIKEMDTISKSVVYIDKMASQYDKPLKEKYYTATKTIIGRINRVLNVLQGSVSASSILITKKVTRINEIFGPIGDSMRVKKACHNLIKKYINIDDTEGQQESFVFNGRESVEEFYDIQNDFDTACVMIEEAFLEQEYTELIYNAILEADGTNDNQDNKQNVQNTETPTEAENKQNIVQKTGSSIMEWLKQILGKLGNTMQRFLNRINELNATEGFGKKYWNDNKENIKNLTLSDTKVNDWYKFNIDAMSNSTYIKFDPNDPNLKDDKSFQEAIMKKITTNLPNFDEKDTFADKIRKIYQGEYVKEEGDNAGKTLQEIGYDHNKAWNYVDEFINKGFGSSILGSVQSDYNNIDSDYKNVSKNIAQYSEQVKDKSKEETPTPNNPEPKKESAIEENDFRFNLAEHFGLVYNEASFTAGPNDTQSAVDNGAQSDNGAGDNKELNSMIKRCFNCNIIAVTAKMTSAVSAYKQYVDLYKFIYKSTKKPNNDK